MVDIARFSWILQKKNLAEMYILQDRYATYARNPGKIVDGKGKETDIDTLIELSNQIKDSSLCGLGQTAPNPVLTTIKYFRHEYEAHIRDKKCPAKNCKPLLTYLIDAEKCTAVWFVKKACAVNAISGEKKQAHLIDQNLCTKCGSCFAKCKFDAINIS